MEQNPNCHPMLKTIFEKASSIRGLTITKLLKAGNRSFDGLKLGTLTDQDCLQWNTRGFCFGKEGGCKFNHRKDRTDDNTAHGPAEDIDPGIKEILSNPTKCGCKEIKKHRAL